jgi:hypothetical protein
VNYSPLLVGYKQEVQPLRPKIEDKDEKVHYRSSYVNQGLTAGLFQLQSYFLFNPCFTTNFFIYIRTDFASICAIYSVHVSARTPCVRSR